MGGPYLLRHCVSDTRAILHLQAGQGRGALTSCRIPSRRCTGTPALRRDKVDQIMDMDDIPAAKNSGSRRFHVFKNYGTAGSAVNGNSCGAGQLVFRNESNAQQNGVAVKRDFRTWYWPAVSAYLGDHNLLHPLPPDDIRNSVREVKGNPIVLQALHNVSV